MGLVQLNSTVNKKISELAQRIRIPQPISKPLGSMVGDGIGLAVFMAE
jgi:hypothetical protein